MLKEKFALMLQFEGGKALLVLRDHDEGRIKVFLRGEWIATIAPGHLLGYDCEAIMLTKDQPREEEWRGSYASIAAGLSTFQQTRDWDEAYDAYSASSSLDGWLETLSAEVKVMGEVEVPHPDTIDFDEPLPKAAEDFYRKAYALLEG